MKFDGGAESLRAQPVLDRQQQLDAAGACPDDGYPRRPVGGQHPLPQLFPCGDEPIDGLDRDGVLRGAGDFGARRRADIERQQIVRHGRPPAAQDEPLFEVETARLVQQEPRPAKSAERDEIDVAVVEAIMAGDQAGQHARIGRMGIAADHRDAHAVDRLHGKALDHRDVAVTAAQQNQILDDGRVALIHVVGFRSALGMGVTIMKMRIEYCGQ